MIKESDWQAISRALLELYSIKDEMEFWKKALYLFHILVPYTQGFWISLDNNLKINKNRSVYDGMKEEVYLEYIDYYYDKDYLKFIFDMTKRTMIYRDTDVMEDSIRGKTEIYRNYLVPNNIPFSAGLLLADRDKVIGIFALFRSKEIGDFSDKDMYIINVMKDHISNMAVALSKGVMSLDDKRQDMLNRFAIQFDFSIREREIMQHFVQGKTYAQIGEALSISESTVKKHIRNIYDKTGAGNRVQLLSMID